MADGDPASCPSRETTPRPPGAKPSDTHRRALLIETIVSPFHCLYQDALEFHTQSHLRLARSEAEAGRLARAALLLYLSSAESLIHQAAVELGRPDLASIVADPSRPLPLADACRLLPAISGSNAPSDPQAAPWPQFRELLSLRASWLYPGPCSDRRAYYLLSDGQSYEPLQPHQVPPGVSILADDLHHPLTGLPHDPYALRPHHLDTARGILDSVVTTLDHLLSGILTRDGRHRKEPVRVIEPR